MSFHTSAEQGLEVVADPCATRVGDMVVSSVLRGQGPAPADCGATQGFCDSALSFMVAGVRAE